MLGVFSDDMAARGEEPAVLMGSVLGMQHVEGLVKDLKAAMDAKVGVHPVDDYFWSGSSVWAPAHVG